MKSQDLKRAGLSAIQRVRQALEESEAQRRALLDSALDCIICTDSQARITDFNAAAERTFRMSKSAALDRDLIETILPPALQQRHRQEMFFSTAPAGIEVLGDRLETRGMRSDGTEFPIELTVNRIVLKKKTTFMVYVRDIAARKRAEKAVVWLAAMIESSHDAIIGKDLNGRITSWNKGAQMMYGYAAEEVVGKNISLLAPLDRINEIPGIIEELRAGRRIENLETVRKTKGGKSLDISLTVSPVLDSDGTVVGTSSIARDITARNLAEEALRKATETSIYASPVPIIATDKTNHVTLWNPAAEAVFGWSEKEVLGKPNPITPENQPNDANLVYKRLFSGETLTGVGVRCQKRDGSIVAISLSATPLWDKAHRVRGIVNFLTDITEHKRVEEALRRAEEKYRSIFEHSIEGIYQTTPDGKYISANPALARMLGFDSPEELINSRQDLRNQEYVSPERHAEFVRSLEAHDVVHDFEYQAYRKDGRVIWVSENAHAVRDVMGKVTHFEGSVQDITEQRELEHQLRQMQKLEAIGSLAGGVAHDFNNILMAISGFSELLCRKMPEADPNRQYIDEIVRATDRGSLLTQRLLAFSRKQVLAPRVVDLNTLITQQMDMLRRFIVENIELRFVPGTGLGTVRVDPGQIGQVVMNLVINSRDAMPDGGEIMIETANSELDDSSSDSLGAVAAGNYVALVVSDNGCGMGAETMSHIFEPFFTTKEQEKGTGLGLSTVFGIVKQSSGHIFVHSEVGQGTTFKICFPRLDEPVQAVFTDTYVGPPRGNETILLVEDDDAVRKSAGEYLRENGYRVFSASLGSEALKMAQQHQGPIHLLLTDLVMPKMSGRELADKVKSIHPETEVVFMSGYSNNLLSRQEILDPKHVFLQKPFPLGVLGRCVRDTLSSGRKH